jgi:sec-independent protein translocase protein TatC
MGMPGNIRAVDHEERLSTVDHLDELRSRLILALVAIALAFGVSFWQNHHLLRLIDAPLAHQTQQQVRDGNGPLGATYRIQQSTRDLADQLRTVVATLNGAPQMLLQRRTLTQVSRNLAEDARRLSAPPAGDRPVTLGIGEPFTTTVAVAFVFALILSLPVILTQAYAYLLPAFAPEQRRAMRSLTVAIPLLFVAGVAFGYFVVLPAAVRFFQNFNSTQFNVLVQAGPYYKFAATTLLAMGVLFEMPAAVFAITRAGLVTPRQLRRNRRYAVALSALVAAALPGDPITMLLETVPLYLLFELSVLVADVYERRTRGRPTAGQPTPDAYGG